MSDVTIHPVRFSVPFRVRPMYHGLANKLLGASPRHLLIVQSMPRLDGMPGHLIEMLVGAAEVLLALWILSGVAPVLCAGTQTLALLTMNAMELMFARQHLLSPAGLLPINLAFLALAWVVAFDMTPTALIRRCRVMLQRHPIPVVADFEHCLVLTYAIPARLLAPLLPPGLTLDTLGDIGFVAVAVVDTRNLRPAGLPRAIGQDFVLAGYRIFCKFRTPEGRTLRGLYILRSEANRWPMVLGGNLLTHYRYHKCRARFIKRDSVLHAVVRTRDGEADLHVRAQLDAEPALPHRTVFRDEREARRFAGPLPFTFDYEPETNAIVVIKGVRAHWRPRRVPVRVGRDRFVERLGQRLGCTPTLASAFYVDRIAYRWERGVRMPLKGSLP